MASQSPHRQRGIAALTAILVVAIATVLAVNLLWTTSVDIQRTQGLLLQDQARLYDLGGEELAKSYLAMDDRDNPGGTDTTEDTPVIARQFQNGQLEGWLVDQQGLFDLNGLVDRQTSKVDEEARNQFVRLIDLVAARYEVEDSPPSRELADATVDWIDPDDSAQDNGAEESYYTNLQPPYRPANFWFTSVSELQAVKGFTPALLTALRPYITALPLREAGGRWPLNVNTAPDLVMASLLDGLTPDRIGGLCPYEPLLQLGQDVRVCQGQDFETIQLFTDAFILVSNGVTTPIPLDLKSNWFLLTVTTSIGTTRSTMYSLLERQDGVVRTRLRSYDAN